MDLCRKILEQVEEKSVGVGGVAMDISGSGYSKPEIAYNVKLLAQAGLIEATNLTTLDLGLNWMPRTLTWQGHEFLGAIRNDTVWNKVKETVKEKGGSIPFEVLKALGLKMAASFFGLGG